MKAFNKSLFCKEKQESFFGNNTERMLFTGDYTISSLKVNTIKKQYKVRKKDP